MSSREIENRLIAVEQEIAHLKAAHRSGADAHPVHAIERIHGIFENDDAFREATSLGRKWRASQRPQAQNKGEEKVIYVLDTDIFTLAELPDSREYLNLHARVLRLDEGDRVVTTIVTYEAQTRGLAWIRGEVP